MTPERWERVAELFAAACECPLEQRLALLERQCGPDTALRQEVDGLLRGLEAAGSFLEAPILPPELNLPPAVAEGAVLNRRFRIQRLLGRGGMGEVYAALDLSLEEQVAVKTLRPEIARDPRFLARLKRELQLCRRITHPHVCRLHDLETDAGGETPLVFFTMELLSGCSLAERLRNPRALSQPTMRRWLEEIAAGLSAAHAQGVIHRDLKPGNVLFRGQPDDDRAQAVITDFGLARRLQEPGLTSRSQLMGTFAYMAPEQLAGDACGEATDVYGFGLIAYELLTRSSPFAGRRFGPPTPPSQLQGGLDPAWDAVVEGCLRPAPSERFPSAQAALARLPAKLAEPLPRRRASRRVRVALAIAAGALLLALFAAVWRYYEVGAAVPPGATALLTPVANASGDPQLDAVDAAMRQTLQQSTRMNWMTSAQINQELVRMARPLQQPDTLARRPDLARELAMRAGAPLVVFGTVSAVGGQLVLALDLERTGNDPGAPARRWSKQFVAGDKSSLFAAIRDGAAWVRRLSGEQDDLIRQTDETPQYITTSSWEALSLFERAEVARDTPKRQNPDDAVALLRQAVTVDPDFALAYMRLGDLLESQGRQAEAYGDYDRALKLAAGGRRLSQREWLRLQGLYRLDTFDFAAGREAFRAYTALYPEDYLGWFYQSGALFETGESMAALAAMERAQILAPNLSSATIHLARLQLRQGDSAGSALAVAYLRAHQWPEPADGLQADIDCARADFTAAEALLLRLRSAQDGFWRSYGYLVGADALAEQGRYREASLALRAGIDDDRRSGNAAAAADKHVALAYLAFKQDHRDEARREIDTALGLDASSPRLMTALALLAEAGFPREAAAWLNQAPQAPGPMGVMTRERVAGEVLLAGGDAAAAAPHLQTAARLQPTLLSNEFLARDLARNGQIAAALLLDQALAEPDRTWSFPELYLPGSMADMTFQAATTADLLGDPRAAASWKTYLQLRSHADPDLPEVLTARQHAHAHLENHP